MKSSNAVDNQPAAGIRYSLYFGILISFQAVITVYFPLYCESLNFGPMLIAIATSLENLAVVVGPLLTTIYLRRFLPAGRSMLVLALFSALALATLLLSTWPLWILFFWFACLFANRSLIALSNVWAISLSESGVFDFARARVWGSIGFIIAVHAIGYCVGLSSAFSALLIGLALLILVIIVLRRYIISYPLKVSENPPHLSAELLLHPPKRIRYFIVSMTFATAALGGLYSYLSIHLKQLGFSPQEISFAWSIGVVAEIIMFLVLPLIQQRFSISSILYLSLFISSIRLFLTGVVTDTFTIYALQTLHAFSFGSTYIASLRLVHFLYPPEKREKGQATLMAMASGIGAVFGRLSAGALLSLTGASTYFDVFTLGGCFSLLGAIIAYRLHQNLVNTQ